MKRPSRLARIKATSISVPVERIDRAILVLRGHKVMLDSDLAALYRVETRVLVQALKRNLERFPRDFVFQLTNQDVRALTSQSGDGLSKSVEGLAVTDDLWSHADEGGCPQQQGLRIGSGAAASEHLANKSPHRFDRVGGSR